MFLPLIFHRTLLLQYSYFFSYTPWKVLLEKGRGLDFWSSIFSFVEGSLFLESLVFWKWGKEKTLIFTRYTHSQILWFVCVEASPGVTGVGNFCSASLRLLWGYLATTNRSFSSAGCNLAFLVEQGTGTGELTPFIKHPWSKKHVNFIPSSHSSQKGKRLRVPLQRCNWVWHNPSWTGIFERRGR